MTKEEVLNAIKKWAKDNGGKTPPEKVFYEDTDAGIYDRMRYWPNYGTLIREAGLTPNPFDKTKYTHEQLCEIFIGVIRENRGWPTRGILDVKHFQNLEFPSSSTFYEKLGLTGDLAKAILKFAEDKKGYEDILPICGAVIKQYMAKEGPSDGGNIAVGFVYLGRQHGNYKIGKAEDVDRRREDITLLGPEPFEMLHWIKTDDMNGVEQYWHNRFKSKRKRGEWFNLSPTDIKAFKRWKKIF